MHNDCICLLARPNTRHGVRFDSRESVREWRHPCSHLRHQLHRRSGTSRYVLWCAILFLKFQVQNASNTSTLLRRNWNTRVTLDYGGSVWFGHLSIGLDIDGVYRISANLSQVQKLRHIVDQAGNDHLFLPYQFFFSYTILLEVLWVLVI